MALFGNINFTRMTFTDLLPMALQTLTEGGAQSVVDYLNPVPTEASPNFDQINDALDKI
jgi:hypothetical protein